MYETWSLCFISGRGWRAGRQLEFWSLLLTRRNKNIHLCFNMSHLGELTNHKAINHVIIFFYLSIRVYPGRRIRIGILFSQGINLELKFSSHGTKFRTLNFKNVCLVQRQRKSRWESVFSNKLKAFLSEFLQKELTPSNPFSCAKAQTEHLVPLSHQPLITLTSSILKILPNINILGR